MVTFQPTYKYHLGCNIYSGDPLPPGVGAVKAVESYASLTDSEATTEGEGPLGTAAHCSTRTCLPVSLTSLSVCLHAARVQAGQAHTA